MTSPPLIQDAQIEVVAWGPFYRATVWVRVHPGSPHRAMFISGQARVTKWGTTAEKAAERCRKRARKVIEHDERVWQEREANTVRTPL